MTCYSACRSGFADASSRPQRRTGLILFEAPLAESRCNALLAWIGDAFPGAKVSHVVVSHIHVDHAACARTMVAQGATLFVGEGAEGLLPEVLAAASTVEPDALQASPVADPPIELVAADGTFSIEDELRPVTVYGMPNTHSTSCSRTSAVSRSSPTFSAPVSQRGLPVRRAPRRSSTLWGPARDSKRHTSRPARALWRMQSCSASAATASGAPRRGGRPARRTGLAQRWRAGARRARRCPGRGVRRAPASPWLVVLLLAIVGRRGSRHGSGGVGLRHLSPCGIALGTQTPNPGDRL